MKIIIKIILFPALFFLPVMAQEFDFAECINKPSVNRGCRNPFLREGVGLLVVLSDSEDSVPEFVDSKGENIDNLSTKSIPRLLPLIEGLEKHYAPRKIVGVFKLGLYEENSQRYANIGLINENEQKHIFKFNIESNYTYFYYIPSSSDPAPDDIDIDPGSPDDYNNGDIKNVKIIIDKGCRDDQECTAIGMVVTHIVNELQKAKYGQHNLSKVEEYCTPKGYAGLNILFRDGKKFTNYNNDVFLTLHFDKGKFYTRGIEVYHKETNELYILEFLLDQDYKVSKIAFCNEKVPPEMWNKYSGLFENVVDFEELKNFYENYQNAFKKTDADTINIEFLEKVFSEDALVIVGKELSSSNNNSLRFNDEKIITYSKKKSERYLDDLKQVAFNNSYLNVSLDIEKVTKSKKFKNIYGLTIKQNWDSPTYKDEGYLLLLFKIKADSTVLLARCWDESGRWTASGLDYLKE